MQESKTTFWKTLRSADDTIRPKNSSTSTVPAEKWTEHFRTLYLDSNDVTGPAEGEGLGGGFSPPIFLKIIKSY